MRLFIGISIPDELKSNIEIAQKQLKSLVKGKFVELKNLHFCLRFLGETNQDKVENITTVMNNIKSPEFDIEIANLGVFPDEKFIKIIFLDISEGKEQLINLANQVEEKLEEQGFSKEERPFKPHLTLCRVKNTDNKEKLLQRLKEPMKIGKFKVQKLELIKSELMPQGPIYEKIHEIQLNG